MKTVFGPVPSRRLGRSLGIDVIPPKTCSYDCIYCESGLTSHLTTKRQAFVSPEEVIHDLESYFDAYPQGADVLTFSSAGEPTLYEPLGELIRSIKARFPRFPLVVLTNGSLLWDPEVRQDLARADRVVPSLDAVTEGAFQRVNRPHPGLDLNTILEGLHAFRRGYAGQLHLEVMLIAGQNDRPDQLIRTRQIIDRLRPHRVELNTVVRPPADRRSRGLTFRDMEYAKSFFNSDKTDIIGRFKGKCELGEDPNLERRVMQMVRRRPCTINEMSISLGVTADELSRMLIRLQDEGRVIRYLFNDEEFIRSAEHGTKASAGTQCG